MIIVTDQNNELIKIKRWTFPAGEYGIRVLDDVAEKHVRVSVLGINEVDIMEVLQLVDAIRRGGSWSIAVHFNYLPYARQDKVHSPGESLSLKLVESMLIQAGASKIFALEIHNPDATKIIKSVQDPVMPLVIENHLKGNNWIVLPDAGAKVRYKDIIPKDALVAYGIKQRDKETGQVLSYQLSQQLPEDANVLVIDDICDGGKTFVELGKLLPCTATLYVTHGIFSKGQDELSKYYHSISACHYKDYI